MQAGNGDIEKAFGRWVRRLREDADLSQQALVKRAQELGVTLDASALSRIESGKRSVGLGEAVALAACLGVDLLPQGLRAILDPVDGDRRRLEAELAVRRASLADLQDSHNATLARIAVEQALVAELESRIETTDVTELGDIGGNLRHVVISREEQLRVPSTWANEVAVAEPDSGSVTPGRVRKHD